MIKSSRHHFSPTRSGFTLIELLTVIAIIGILAAILVPIISRVRQAASQAVAISNMRQMGLAIQAFATDHNDRMPGVYRSVNGVPDSSLFLWSGQRAYGSENNFQGPDQLGPYIDAGVRPVAGQEVYYTELMDPPAYARQFPDGNATSHLRATDVRHDNGRTASNPFGVGRGDDGSLRNSMTLTQMSRAFTLSRRWALIEIDQTSPPEVEDGAGNWPWPTPPEPLHGDGWVALMFDGSVSFLKRGDPLLDNQRTENL